jgi:hypothetical protein
MIAPIAAAIVPAFGEILQALPLPNGATINTNVNVAGDGSIQGDGSSAATDEAAASLSSNRVWLNGPCSVGSRSRALLGVHPIAFS